MQLTSELAFLPEGLQAHDYRVKLMVEIEDEVGGVTLVPLEPVVGTKENR